jgi:hypothetical protein
MGEKQHHDEHTLTEFSMKSTREQPAMPGANPLAESVASGRRRFVQGVTAVLSGVVLGLGRAWAIDMHVFSADQSATLLAMIHTIAPHDGLDEAAYALVAAALDADAAASAQTRELMTAGLTGLGLEFARADEDVRVAKLKALEAAPPQTAAGPPGGAGFFQAVRIKTLLVLYNNPIAWTHFGYEGEAFSKGGYLLRGFNDLKWLPEVPLDASGPMPV